MTPVNVKTEVVPKPARKQGDMGKMDEMILVTERENIFKYEGAKEGLGTQPPFTGFKTIAEQPLPIDKHDYAEKRRGDMEEDPSYKQLITYAIIVDKQSRKVFQYGRGSNSGESRLQAMKSIGVGGHSNAVDTQTLAEEMLINLKRELEEELHITTDDITAMHLIGFVNDDNSDVNVVHYGFVYYVEVADSSRITIKEKKVLEEGNFTSLEQLRKEVDRFEDWSKFLIENEQVAKIIAGQ